MAEERETPQEDVEAHGNAPGQTPGRLDEGDPDELKLKLANDEDDDVEAHGNVPGQVPGAQTP